MRRCQRDFYLDIEVMTCHSSLVLPSSSSATCSAWELSLGRDIWNFFRLQVATGLPPVLGHKWCMPTNYKVTITIVINHHLPTLFLLLDTHRSRIQCFQILRFQSPECHSLFTDLEVTSQLFEAITVASQTCSLWNYCELINFSIAHL